MRIGLDVGGTKIEGCLMDDNGRIVSTLRIATPKGDYSATLQAIHHVVTELKKHTTQELTIGLGIPGALSLATGLVKNANSTWLNGKPFKKDLEHMLEQQIRIANDANCFALSEAIDGAAQDASIVFGVILGTGCGGGIVYNKQVFQGMNAIAGEWGHNPLPWANIAERDTQCYCGKQACIETFVSGTGLAKDYLDATGEESTVQKIVALAQSGNTQAKHALDRHTSRLARALAHIINVIDPHVIVLGGGLSKMNHLYHEVPRLWTKYVFSDRVDTKLVRPKYGDASGVRGAAWLWSMK